jgi:ubiquinone/menaquinone biosynthesis C-methylase UbiE
MTPAMVEKARHNVQLAGLANIEVHESDISRLPLPDACVDVVISNAVINLAPDKRSVFREANRVLRSGGQPDAWFERWHCTTPFGFGAYNRPSRSHQGLVHQSARLRRSAPDSLTRRASAAGRPDT